MCFKLTSPELYLTSSGHESESSAEDLTPSNLKPELSISVTPVLDGDQEYWMATSPTKGISPEAVLDYLMKEHPSSPDGHKIFWQLTTNYADFPSASKCVFTGKIGKPWIK